MKYFIIFIVLFLISFYAKSQVGTTTRTQDLIISGASANYVVGIGNEEEKMFLDVLALIRNTNGVKVTFVCESQSVVAVTVIQNAFKSYDVFRDLLLAEYSNLLLFRKDNTILVNDCKDEILKQ